jgi:ribosome-associated translation inhibitor RaiA
MAGATNVVIHLKDARLQEEERERLRSAIERRCQGLGEEFHEVARVEVTLLGDGGAWEAHGHATGKGTDVATHSRASEPGPAADQLLDRIERQLRRIHDKRIFSQRRDAQRDPPKRKPRA